VKRHEENLQDDGQLQGCLPVPGVDLLGLVNNDEGNCLS
jgi:hypothetical protein